MAFPPGEGVTGKQTRGVSIAVSICSGAAGLHAAGPALVSVQPALSVEPSGAAIDKQIGDGGGRCGTFCISWAY